MYCVRIQYFERSTRGQHHHNFQVGLHIIKLNALHVGDSQALSVSSSGLMPLGPIPTGGCKI